MLDLTDVINQMNLTNIYRTFHPNTREYNFFLVPDQTFSKIDHITGHKTNLNRYKKVEITPSILPEHHGLKLDINHNRISWKLNNYLLIEKNGQDRN